MIPSMVKKQDSRVDKRCVTMTNWVAVPPAKPGDEPGVQMQQVKDYVRPDLLDAYVADAQTRWQDVAVSDEPDAGPAGYHGQTAVPGNLDHPLAGQVFAATQED